MLEYIILGMLLDGERTGYEVRGRIEAGVGMFYRASWGSLYPTLERLAARGDVEARGEAGPGRARRFYRATEQGRAAFDAWLREPLDDGRGNRTHLAKVYFFDRLDASARRNQLLGYEHAMERQLAELERLAQRFGAAEDAGAHYYKMSTLWYGIGVLRESLRWCRRAREGRPFSERANEGEE